VLTNNTPTIGTQNIETQNNIQSQTNTYNQTVIINFPESMDDDDFKLLRDHMTVPHLEKIFSNKFKPKQGFARYTNALLERPENRNVYKPGPNTKYSRVWKDGNWVYELDEDVYPLLTYHMTIAALDDINTNKKALTSRGRIDYIDIAKCLDDINTENDENDNYSYALEKLKVAVMNFSERFRLPTSV
jgi:hypothetical protein